MSFVHLKFYYDESCSKPCEEMLAALDSSSGTADNTLKVAEWCHFEMELYSKEHLPKFPVPDGKTADVYLEELCRRGFTERFGTDNPDKAYMERLKKELGIIKDRGFADYFLILWDIIKFAHYKGILTGYGRGSAPGSLAAYLLGITKIDPLAYGLLFERFINPDQADLPVVGTDISRRSIVDIANYCFERWGARCGNDKEDTKASSVAKMDFFRKRYLDMLEGMLASSTSCLDEKINLEKIPLDAPEAFKLLENGELEDLFLLDDEARQVYESQAAERFEKESINQKETLRRALAQLKPICLSDFIALTALCWSPGPIKSGLLDDYIARRQGNIAISYAHPLLEPILKETCGLFLYQEQIMLAASEIAGLSLGEADNLRKALGKLNLESINEYRAKFISGAMERGADEQIAAEIFQIMQKSARHCFNKSHAVACALHTYHLAWLKAYLPLRLYKSMYHWMFPSPESYGD